MTTNDAAHGLRLLSINVGRVTWPSIPDSAGNAEIAGNNQYLPILREAWTDRDVVQHSVLVRQVGGALTGWVEPTSERPLASILDLVVLHDEASLVAQEGWRVPETICQFRIVIGEPEALDSDAVWGRLPRAHIAVSASIKDLDSLAFSLIEVMATQGLIGIDAQDVLDAAGCRGSMVARGRAIVIPGKGIAAGLLVRDALAELSREEEIGGLLIYQAVSRADTACNIVMEIDEMAQAATRDLDIPVMLTGNYGRPSTQIVAIAFKRNI